MTPKEKAEDLLYQMRYDHMSGTLTKRKAKRCALIAVDEMISYFQKETFMMAYPEIAISEAAYWQEVKKEIEAL